MSTKFKIEIRQQASGKRLYLRRSEWCTDTKKIKLTTVVSYKLHRAPAVPDAGLGLSEEELNQYQEWYSAHKQEQEAADRKLDLKYAASRIRHYIEALDADPETASQILGVDGLDAIREQASMLKTRCTALRKPLARKTKPKG